MPRMKDKIGAVLDKANEEDDKKNVPASEPHK